jgi:HAE1 family hydrophobic/amphiphilic exporter-1
VTLSDISIERPVLTWMMVLALLVFGVLGYARLGVDQFPDMEFPQITVFAVLDGATPEGMEEDVTDVLEEQLNSISGVRSLRSTSHQGIASIAVEFELGTDMDAAVQDVRDQVAAARPFLPRDVEPPTVRKRSASGYPVVYVPFSSDHRPLVDVSEYVRRHVKPLLETIPGASGVLIWGRRDRNIRIWIDSDTLGARGLAASDVLAALAREHVDVPGGIVESETIEWSVKTEAEFRSVAELEAMVVAQRGEASIHLRDVARVEDGVEDVRDLTRFNGVPSVVAAVTKQTDANTVAVVDEVYRRIEELRPLLPDGIDVVDSDQFIDFSISIRESVREAKFALFFGGALAVFVVFVFLRRTRPTLIIAAAIPLSLVATFGIVWAFGYTLNTMTLLGMTLAIGVVIDDAIIVLENIERHREMGKPGKQAASEGTRQIVFAATAATLSVAAVFLPVAFAEGIVGNFLGEFGLTVAGAVLVSLFVALTITPMLAARIPAPGKKAHGSVYQRLEAAFRTLEAGYRRLLDWSLQHRLATFAIALASFALAIVFGQQLPSEFFPAADGRVVFLQFETPPGTSVDGTAEILSENERYMMAQPEVLGAFAGIGHTAATGAGRPNSGGLFTTLVPSDERSRTSQEIMRDAREALGAVPGQKLNINDPLASLSSTGELQLQIRGNLAVADLDDLASKVIQALAQRGGYVDLNKDLEIGLPEVRVVPDRKKAAALGVDAATVASVVRVMIGGLDVGTFKEQGRRYDIRMRLARADRDTPAAVNDLSVRSRSGNVVELRNLVDVETGAAASQISRVDRQRAVTISANLEGKALGSAIDEAFEVGREVLPAGVNLRLAGQAEAMQESGRQFALMLGLAILVIYMLLAAQFESFVLPSR